MNVSLILCVALSLTLVPLADSHRCYGQYMCKRGPTWRTRRICINKAAICDNTTSCPLNDDEQDCPAPVATCPLLGRPTNGNVYIDGLQAGGTAEYSCNEDFVLSNSTSRTCNGASWDGSEPTCIARTVPKSLQ